MARMSAYNVTLLLVAYVVKWIVFDKILPCSVSVLKRWLHVRNLLATLCWQVLLDVTFEPFNVYFCHRCWQFIRNHNTWSVACCVLHWFHYHCHLHHIHQEETTRYVNTSLYNHCTGVVWNILFSVCDWFEHPLLSPWHHHHHVLVYVCIYVWHVPASRSDGVADNSHNLSDINRQETAGHEHDYYNVDNSSDVNKETPYQELNVDRQPPVVYQQLGRR